MWWLFNKNGCHIFYFFIMKFVYLKKNTANPHFIKSILQKNTLKSFFTLLCLICFVFCLSCTNLIESDTNNNCFADSAPLQMDITSDEGYIFFNNPAIYENNNRTIIPCYDSSDYVYYIFYRDSSRPNSNGSIENITFVPLTQTTGTISHNFSKTYYEFELFALTQKMNGKMTSSAGELTRNILQVYASLRASTFVDLRYEERTVFHLKANTLSTGKGSFKVTVQHQDDWEVQGNYSVTAGLYSVDDDELVYPPSTPFTLRSTQAASSSINQSFSSFENDDTENILQNVQPGTYNLIVKYNCYDSSNTTILKTFEYSDKINIIMNQTTTASFVIPDFMDKKPEAPSHLLAAYKLPDKNTPEYYSVQFKWEDNSKTENYFNLELLKTDGDEKVSSITSDDDWNDLTATYGTSVSYDYLSQKRSVFYVDGSLSKNSAYYTMNLPLGSRFVARICAVNNTGNSEWTYITFPTSQEFEDLQMTFDEGFSLFNSETADDVTTLNLYRINYETRNGTLTATKDDSDTELPLTLLYNIQHNNNNESFLFYPDGNGCTYISSIDNDVNNPVKTTADALSLTYNANAWSYWTKDYFSNDTHITAGSDYVYTGHKNVTFFAHYKNDDSASYEQYYLAANDIYIHFFDDGNFTTQLTEEITLSEKSGRTLEDLNSEDEAFGLSSNYIKISKSKISSIQFDIKHNIIDDRKYDNSQLVVKRSCDSKVMTTQSLSAEMIKSSVGFSSKEWTTGEYYIEINVHSSDFVNSRFSYYLYLIILD